MFSITSAGTGLVTRTKVDPGYPGHLEDLLGYLSTVILQNLYSGVTTPRRVPELIRVSLPRRLKCSALQRQLWWAGSLR
jgi:hypothetical protein